MKQTWRAIRVLLHDVARNVVVRLVGGLLALLGATTVVEPQAAVDVRNGVLAQPPAAVVPAR